MKDISLVTPLRALARHEGAYRVGETRVSLDSLIYLFREGMSVEAGALLLVIQ